MGLETREQEGEEMVKVKEVDIEKLRMEIELAERLLENPPFHYPPRGKARTIIDKRGKDGSHLFCIYVSLNPLSHDNDGQASSPREHLTLIEIGKPRLFRGREVRIYNIEIDEENCRVYRHEDAERWFAEHGCFTMWGLLPSRDAREVNEEERTRVLRILGLM